MTWGICNDNPKGIQEVPETRESCCLFPLSLRRFLGRDINHSLEEYVTMKLEDIVRLIGCLGCLAVVGIWSLIAILVVKGILSFF